jgi:hypothetical protein
MMHTIAFIAPFASTRPVLPYISGFNHPWSAIRRRNMRNASNNIPKGQTIIASHLARTRRRRTAFYNTPRMLIALAFNDREAGADAAGLFGLCSMVPVALTRRILVSQRYALPLYAI